jgi:predicted transcriptional regulator
MKATMKAREVRRRMAAAAFGILKAKGLKVREIARRAKLPYRSVYRWAKGAAPHDAGLSKLWKLVAKVGGKPPDRRKS